MSAFHVVNLPGITMRIATVSGAPENTVTAVPDDLWGTAMHLMTTGDNPGLDKLLAENAHRCVIVRNIGRYEPEGE